MAVEIGSLDRVTSIAGERGTGKSTFAIQDARVFQRETGGYSIGHSPNGQVGHFSDVEFHSDVRKLLRGLRRHPEKHHFLVRGNPEEVLEVGVGLATAVRRRAHHERWLRFREDRPAPKGLKAPPVLVTIDEGIRMRRRPTREELAWLEELLVSARHKHLAVTWSIQAPSARSWVLFEQSNRLRVFRYTHEWGLNALRAAGLPREVVPEIPALERFEFFSWDKLAAGGRFAHLPAPSGGSAPEPDGRLKLVQSGG